MQQDENPPSSTVNSNHFNRYFHYAISLISSYNGNEPFHLFLRKYFSKNKKHGPRDRKLISSLCYNYFRLGHGVILKADFTEKFLLSTFLCETHLSLLLEVFKSEWNTLIHLTLYQKLKVVTGAFNAEEIFPFRNELSDEINFHDFILSFLQQPNVFLRIRPGCRQSVINKLKKGNFFYNELGNDSLAFSENEKLTDLFKIDEEVAVQDYSSQKTLDLIKPLSENLPNGISIWDCCAGSGGKSILAADIFRNVNLTVSDKRKNILENCKLRFSRAGITNYELALADLQIPSLPSELSIKRFDLIIADVPCTGSGTWSRTPEQLTFFHKKNIDKYAALQKKIIANTFSNLKKGGYFLYITCSVFKKENEENVAFIQQNFELHLEKMEYLKGYKIQADTLFAALFKKIAATELPA